MAVLKDEGIQNSDLEVTGGVYMDKKNKMYLFAGGWILGRPKKKFGEINAGTSPGGFIDSGKPGGIFSIEWDEARQRLSQVAHCGEGIPAGFVVPSPDGNYLYAAWEGNTYDRRVASGGCVYAYRIHPQDGTLEFMNRRSSIGSCTNYLSMDTKGKFLFVSNHGEYGAISKIEQNANGLWEVQPKYDDASLAVFHINADGSVGDLADIVVLSGEERKRGMQWGPKGIGPHLHCVTISPDDQLVIACDIAFARLLLFHFDKENGRLMPCMHPVYQFPEEIKGVRHVIFHPYLPYIFAIADGLCSLKYNEDNGKLDFICRIENTEVDGLSMCLSPGGKFLYFNGGSQIYTYRISENDGTLAFCESIRVPSGSFSRSCCMDASGKYLFTTDVESDNVICFLADADTGKLTYADVVGNIWGSASICAVSYGRRE